MLLLHSEVAAESFFKFSPFSYVALKPNFGTKFKILKNMKTTLPGCKLLFRTVQIMFSSNWKLHILKLNILSSITGNVINFHLHFSSSLFNSLFSQERHHCGWKSGKFLERTSRNCKNSKTPGNSSKKKVK